MDIPAPYLDVIRQQWPDAAHLRMNRDGLVNDVVMAEVANDTWVFRFPKTEDGRRALEKETRILDVVRQYVSLPVPAFQPLLQGAVMYRLIAGVPLDRNTLLRQSAAAQNQIAEQLGHFLHQLHTIPAELLTNQAIPADMRVNTPEAWAAQFETIRRELYPLLWADQKAWADELFAPVLDGGLDMGAYLPSLIHDDLASYHILFDAAQSQINGVIDFGVAHIGDPARDVALLINVLGESVVSRMRPSYPEIETDTLLDRARFLAGMLELQWVLAGLRTKDNAWFTVHLGRARDIKPIGHAR